MLSFNEYMNNMQTPKFELEQIQLLYSLLQCDLEITPDIMETSYQNSDQYSTEESIIESQSENTCDNIELKDICNFTPFFSLNNLLSNFNILNLLIKNEHESNTIMVQEIKLSCSEELDSKPFFKTWCKTIQVVPSSLKGGRTHSLVLDINQYYSISVPHFLKHIQDCL